MERQTHESPMDFTWTNGNGPIDRNSPFITSLNALPPQTPSKRPRSAFEDTSKPQQSSFPALRAPAGQTTFFNLPSTSRPSSPNKPLPPNPALFSTPRRLEVDFSSGGETPETPDLGLDTDATPEMPPKKAPSFTAGKADKPAPKKRDSLLGRLFLSSPSRPAPPPQKQDKLVPYSHKAEKRVATRRRTRKDSPRRDKSRRDDSADSSWEDENDSSRRPRKAIEPKPGVIGAALSYMEAHPTLPHILSFYLQLLLNFVLMFGVLYILYSFWRTIRADVDEKANEAAGEIMREIAVCAKHFRDNGCDSTHRAPALQSPCAAWQACMGKDPRAVGRARVSAHTFAQIFNSFIEPISYKAMIFSLLFVFGCMTLSNMAFGLFRRHDPYMAMHHAPQHPHPPQTPSLHRQVSGLAYAAGYGTPFRQVEFGEGGQGQGGLSAGGQGRMIEYH
ncbi:hypothetical protein EJ06DRAFT_585363 [Trichodelitschia bisporula]|uniref:Brl1/Brr6 domain-containing protein n=1 Tax=Trichodelitschia bisporula TaxID=703511 RepID=A0A6G1HJ64_9PEZI|nr:hypothetical protein EJ06DRAFT_585363 [Trichodelitschia bisporula]